jgi:hypothetical protein
MRALAQPVVLKNAALAALLTTLACLPQLFAWEERQAPIWYLTLALLLAAFVLWAFVFAWHNQYVGQNPFDIPRRPGLWLAATACGMLGAAATRVFVDPKLRALLPEEFPTDPRSWLASVPFALFFIQLFLVFAPVAFFIRLFRKREAAMLLTLLFNAFVVMLKAAELHLPHAVALQMLVIRILVVTIAVFFYLEGGVWTIWWMTLLIQAKL